MLNVNNIALQLGTKTLYEDLSLHIKPNEKIGLIGANGTGKSSLFRVLTGEYTPDEGEVAKSKDCKIGFLDQNLLSLQIDKPITDVVLEAFDKELKLELEINALLQKMETEYSDQLLEQLGTKQELFEQSGGYQLRSRAEEILEGLGFQSSELNEPLSSFSGGWRMRVILAKILLANPDLLLLDEPTNHLDLPSIIWLEKYIQDYPGSVVIISHDKTFLDNTISQIYYLANQGVQIYKGNYSKFLEQKQEREEIQQNAFQNQQKKIQETEAFINRFKAKATKAKQVQSRVKALEKMDRVGEIQNDNRQIHFEFAFSTQPGKIILKGESVSQAYDSKTILNNTSFTLARGDKVALIGANGTGKSTVLKVVTQLIKFDGNIQEGHNVQKALFAQHQLEDLDLESTILQEMMSMGLDKPELEIRNLLGAFLFSDDDISKKIKVLSGGEKSRVALAKTLLADANFLMLDEPTNHLDISSINMLTQALQQYKGSFIIVSHNRDFITNVANKIWYIEGQQVKEYPGTYAEYNQDKKSRNQDSSKPEIVKNTSVKPIDTSPSINKQSQESFKQQQKELKTLEKKVQQTEVNIEKLENKKTELEHNLSQEKVYGNPELLAEVSAELKSVEQELESLTQQWELNIEKLDQFNRG